jgi:ferredoxin/flavodoxin---NADP+ reductase
VADHGRVTEPGAPADGPVGMGSVDLLIIGAGPAGLYAGYYAGFRGLSTALMDSLPEPGGQITALYPEKLIFDVAGFPEIRGRELVDNLVKQVEPFDPTYLLGHTAEKLERRSDESLVITSAEGAAVHARAVIITGGIGTFAPRPLPVGEHYLGRGLSYFVPRLAVYEDLDVIVVGGGDSAFDWAFNLHPIARSIRIVHRRDRFRAHEGTVRAVTALGIPIDVFTEVEALHGDERVEAVDLRHKPSGEIRRVEAQGVIAALGFTADLGPLMGWGLQIERKQVLVDTRMHTNVPRVFAAGDITEYPGKVRLISVGFGEAAVAVNNAAVVIDPAAHLFPGHSSEPG